MTQEKPTIMPWYGEASEIYCELGLTPRQLLEQRDELLTIIRIILVAREQGVPLEGTGVLTKAQQAIAKIEGKHD